MASQRYLSMLFPFGMNRRCIRLWHAFLPRSQAEYGCAKYTLTPSSFNSDNLPYSEPLSEGMVWNTLEKFAPYSGFSYSIASIIASAEWSRNFSQIDIRRFRSVRLIIQGCAAFFPSTESISQFPKSSLFSILSSRRSILSPRFFLFLRTFSCLVFGPFFGAGRCFSGR